MIKDSGVQGGFFDADFRLEEISAQGDPLEKLDQHVDWEIFRVELKRTFRPDEKDASKGGRPPYDYVMMFKILILQHLYGIADERTEFAIKDRLSFMRFLGLKLVDKVPDEKTIWLFRERLSQLGSVRKMFRLFERRLEKSGLVARKGSIVDASFVEVPRQRNTRDENDDIRNGKTPEEWKEDPAKLSQKDVDARWAKKNGERHFGYKNHVKVDRKSKLITDYETSDASVHDSQMLDKLVKKKDSHHELYADSAYQSEDSRKMLKRKNIRNRIHERAYRSHPLTDKQMEKNRLKSKIRARVEHVFGFVTNTMGGFFIRCIGRTRADTMIGLKNLTYNLSRSVQLCRA
ncbi:MAG: IS5 family transposase [Candidatus Yonathbacteria bacterium]|nr:IS5 family transposase [Candidatus Yonathbacteria bacterium]